MKNKLERITIMNPAFDRRNPNPSKNYGIHCVQCWMVLKGEKGVVHFTFGTGMFLPETIKEYYLKGHDLFHFEFNSEQSYYMGYDVGYHSLTPQFEGQQIGREKCEWLDGKSCYCDGSALRAEKFMDILVREGSEAIWKLLEEDYKELFKN